MAERKPSYWEQLRDPRWQRKRLEVMQRAGFKCEECGDAGTTLNVHHTCYRKGAAPWEYSDSVLRCWCEPCHEKWHAYKSWVDDALGRLGFESLTWVAGYVEGDLYATGIGEPSDKRLVTRIEVGCSWWLGLMSGLGVPDAHVAAILRSKLSAMHFAEAIRLGELFEYPWEDHCYQI